MTVQIARYCRLRLISTISVSMQHDNDRLEIIFSRSEIPAFCPEKLLAPGLGGGTQQFWKIFGDMAGTSTNQRYGGPADARLRSWIETLQRLDELGVWLLDSSLHGIYRSGTGRIVGT